MKKILLAVGILAGASGLAGADNIFQTAGSWHKASNWSLGIVPTNGEAVTVAAHVTLTNPTARLASYTLNAGVTNTFTRTNAILYATTALIRGTMTHSADVDGTTTNALGRWILDNWVYIQCTDLRLTASGRINCDAKGYAGAPFNTNEKGRGPGGGPGGSLGAGGGGYGGAGGNGLGAGGGIAYGSMTEPGDAGSGGGCGNGAGTTAGGKGGGYVRIAATGTVTIEGIVTADGEYVSPPSHRGGGGSGGGVYIACAVLAGTNGLISTDGGNGNIYAGGGGGGRIALVCSSAAQLTAPRPRVLLSCAYGKKGSDAYTDGQNGTVYVNDYRLLPDTWQNHATLYGPTEWRSDSLTVRNCTLTPSLAPIRIYVAGDMRMSNATLRLYSSPRTNAALTVNGSMTLLSNSWINSYITAPRNLTCTGAVFDVGDALIYKTSGINANGSGYAGGLEDQDGYGPGYGRKQGGGAGHGGAGGKGGGNGGPTYDSLKEPVLPGSGGAGNFGGTPRLGGPGGGAIRLLAARTCLLNGTLTANGTDSNGYGAGGGSGGSIYVRCVKFAGLNPALSATGGRGGTGGGEGGGGGGGRIAVWSWMDLTSGVIQTNVAGGTGNSPGLPGGRGTVFFGNNAPAGTAVSLR
jgi:hypothetical protein